MDLFLRCLTSSEDYETFLTVMFTEVRRQQQEQYNAPMLQGYGAEAPVPAPATQQLQVQMAYHGSLGLIVYAWLGHGESYAKV